MHVLFRRWAEAPFSFGAKFDPTRDGGGREAGRRFDPDEVRIRTGDGPGGGGGGAAAAARAGGAGEGAGEDCRGGADGNAGGTVGTCLVGGDGAEGGAGAAPVSELARARTGGGGGARVDLRPGGGGGTPRAGDEAGPLSVR